MNKLRITVSFLVLLVLVAGIVIGTEGHESVPYNVRELFSKSNRLLTVTFFAITIGLMFSGPVLSSILTTRRKSLAFGAFPVFLLLCTSLAWILLRLSVPLESLYDVIGAPILDWPWEWESLLRFMALAAGPWTAFFLSSLFLLAFTSRSRSSGTFSIVPLLETFPVLAMSWVLIFPLAATDNLTELVVGQGSAWAGLMVLGALLVIGLGAGLISWGFAHSGCIKWFPAAIALLLGTGGGSYLFLSAGLEGSVSKYGQSFSTLQFLLSPGRDALLSGSDLVLRFFILHIALLILMVLCQYPVWSWSESRRARDSH